MFKEKAVPHLLSFLPNLHIIKIDTTVFLTAFTHAYAFSTNGQMVISQSSSFWGNDLNKVLNLLTHELFHVGHGSSLAYAKEDPLDDSLKNEFLMTLHSLVLTLDVLVPLEVHGLQQERQPADARFS